MRLGRYRFTHDETGWRWHRWCCGDGMRAIYRATPWGAWLALSRWYRRYPRGHWPGCDGNHHRAAICPAATDWRGAVTYEQPPPVTKPE